MGLLDLDAKRRELLRRRQEQQGEGTGKKTAPAIPRREPGKHGEPAPLSFAQRRLWFLERLEPGTARYHIPIALDLEGELSPARLAGALAAVTARHGALRSRILEQEGEPRQVVAPVPPAAALLPVVDLRGLPEKSAAAQGEILQQAVATLPFDLSTGRPLRGVLLRRGAHRHRLVLCLHHIATDAWSMAILVRELGAFYGGGGGELPAPPVDYADFAVWQRQQAAAGALDESLAQRRRALEGAPELDLPARAATSREQEAAAGGTRPAALPPGLAGDLERFAARHHGTPFLVLLTTLGAVLHRWTGQRDFALGTPVAGRQAPGVAETVGCFVNMLAMRLQPTPESSFADFFARTREAALEAFDHQEVPFERLVEEIAPRRQGRPPIFQAALSLQGIELPELELPGLSCRVLPVATGAVKLELLLTLGKESGGGYRGEWEHARARWSADAVERLQGHLLRLAADALAEPTQPLAALDLLSPAERHQLTVETRAEEKGYRHRSLWQRFEDHALRHPDAPAISFREETWSYGELYRRALDQARSLAAAPPGPVIVDQPRSLGLVAAILAAAAAGRPYVPLDPETPEERRRLILDDLQAGSAEALGFGHHPEAPAYLIYTSGSTGRPKAVVVSHRAAARLFDAAGRHFEVRCDDVWTLFHSHAFDFSVWELWGALAHGSRLVVVPYETSRDPQAFARLLRDGGITVLSQTPSALRMLLADREFQERPPTTLRSVVCGGEALPRETVEAFFRVFPEEGSEPPRLVNMYGITETTVHVTYHQQGPPEDEVMEIAEGTTAIGRPLDDLAVYLLDSRLRPVPLGAVGELAVGGAHADAGLARGYHRRPALTARRFVPDPFSRRPGARLYRSGDLALRASDGSLLYRGRGDAQVQLRGFRVEPGEVAAVLARHPAVSQAVVLARQRSADDLVLAAYFVPETSSEELEASQELRQWLARHLPPYMLPAVFVELDTLPLTSQGKLDVRALPDPWEEESGGEQVAPRGSTEERLAEIWRHVLRLPAVGRHQDFFDLGGHSLLATRIVAAVQRELGVELPVAAVFEAPTLELLAGRIAAAASDPATEEAIAETVPKSLQPDPATHRGGTFPATAAQRRLWFLEQLQPGSSSYHIPLALELRGPLQPSLLAAALTALRRRHGALRTSLPVPAGKEEGGPVQRVAPPAADSPATVDLGGLPEAARRNRLERLIEAFSQLPFDLHHGPLFRALLLRLERSRHALLLDFHHAVMDGWSLNLLLRELAELYRPQLDPPAVAKLAAELPPALQYADYARWEAAGGGARERQRDLDYWRQKLQSAPPPVNLPADGERRGGDYRGGRASRTLDAALCRRLEEAARERHTTLFSWLLAILGTLVHRLAGPEDLIIGSPVAGRNRPEVQATLGCFVNMLALRLDASVDPSFERFLQGAQETTTEALSHSAAPFEALLEELAPDRDPDRPPLFSVLLNVQHLEAPAGAPTGGLGLGDLEVRELRPAEPGAKLDWTLYVRAPAADAPDGGIRLDLVYNRALFHPRRMEVVVAQLESLLEQSVAAPETPLSHFRLAVSGDGLPDPQAPLPRPEAASQAWTPRDKTVEESVAAVALANPRGSALVDAAGRTLPYAEVMAAARSLAAALRTAGLTAGARVGILGRRSRGLAPAVLGVWQCGAATVLLDAGEPLPRLLRCLDQARPAALLDLTGGGTAQALEEASREGPALPEILLPLGDPEDGPWPSRVEEEAVEGHGNAPPAPSTREREAHILFTSGSTGEPRGVVSGPEPLAHFLAWQRQTFALGAEDRWTLLSGVGHDPVLRDLFAPLTAGGSLWIPPSSEDASGNGGPLDGAELLQGLQRAGVTVLHLTPATAELLVTAAAEKDHLPQLRLVCFAADRLPVTTALAFRRLAPKARLVGFYGTTETPQGIAWHELHRLPEDLQGSDGSPLGRGIDGVQLLVLDRHGSGAGVGERGEIVVRSRFLARGYLGETESWFPAGEEGLYRTGDLGRYRPDGTVVFVGRGDRQVKIRGRRVEPAEVEAALARHPAVALAAVEARAARGDHDFGADRELVAFVELQPTAQETGSELRRWVAQRLPPALVPTLWSILPRLPRTASGKVDRRALPSLEGGSDALEGLVAPTRPLTATEELVAAAWGEILDLDRPPHPHLHFFDLGGHSLLAARLQARLRSSLGVSFPLRLIFEAPRLDAFARRLEELRRELRPRDSQLPALGSIPIPEQPPLAPAQERLWFLQRLEPHSPAYNMPFALELRGELDFRALSLALTSVAQRQAVLRTTLPAQASSLPYQRVDPAAPVPAPCIDLRQLVDAEAEALELQRREAARPFDLEEDMPWRVLLLLLPGAGSRARLLLTLHHAAADGWALGILARDLITAYRRALERGDAGGPSLLPPTPLLPTTPVSYVDYALWQRQAVLEGSKGSASQLDETVRRLRRTLPKQTPEIPGDRQRSVIHSSRAGRRAGELTPAITGGLRRLAREHGATPFMVLSAAFLALIHRLTGSPRPVLATPHAGRSAPELEELVGVFVNVLVLTVNLEPQPSAAAPSFGDLVRKTREATLEALDAAAVPFDRLVQALAPRREAHRTPLFQIMLAPQDAPTEALQLPGLEWKPLPPEPAAARFDLSWLWTPEGEEGAMQLVLEYRAELYDAATAERLARQLERLLAAGLERPATALAELPLLSPGESRQLEQESSLLVEPPARGPAREPDQEPAVGRDPRDRLELELLHLWQELLRLPSVTMNDDFFALGGHSILAVRLVGEVRDRFGVDLALADLYGGLTPASLAAAVRRRGASGASAPEPRSRLVTLRPPSHRHRSGAPWLWVHPGGGSALPYVPLAQHLDAPVYGVQAPGLEAGEEPVSSVGRLAELYAAAIRTEEIPGPYRLAGWSFGGLVAFELARHLQTAGEEVALLSVLDMGPRYPLPAPREQRWAASPEELFPGLEIGAEEREQWQRQIANSSDEDEALRWLIDLVRHRGLLPADFGLAEARRYLAVTHASRTAQRSWRPEETLQPPYAGPLLLLRPEQDRDLYDVPEDLGWGDIAAQVEVVWVAGSHGDMVDPPHAEALARLLRTYSPSSNSPSP
ncbi:MAG: condensation domain-containing protein [Acidobacteriota bacterium]|nr:condensation domain-containing protein [Acidobacteriota bacterium]